MGGKPSTIPEKMNSPADFANWLSMGSVDMIRGVISPEEQFSKEHWQNSFGLFTIVAGGGLARVNTGPTPKTVPTVRVPKKPINMPVKQWVSQLKPPVIKSVTNTTEWFRANFFNFDFQRRQFAVDMPGGNNGYYFVKDDFEGGRKSSGGGTGRETYQHHKDYKNNKYFTRSVEYNAGKDGTGFTYKVYQRGDINWDMIRTKGAKKGRGLTNAEASEKYGLAPILDDAGSVATLHHSQQKGVGPLYEASTRYHNISNAKKAPLHPYKGRLNPFYPMDETTRGAFQKVDSINYWKIRGKEALGGK